jgi:hypothetical protein
MISNQSWGLDIGTGATLTIRTMVYSCSVPNNSYILAYEEKICQYPDNNPPANGTCAGGDTSPSQGQADTITAVQDNGLACLADASNQGTVFMWRNGSGLQNTGTNPLSIYCPLSRPSSDSRTQQGALSVGNSEVYWRGDPPTNCKLSCRDQFTASVSYSAGFSMRQTSFVDHLNSNRPEVPHISSWQRTCSGALGLDCSLPSLTTMLGIIHEESVPPVDLGI